MSSSRFPGKALAPFAGVPMVMHTVTRAREALPREDVIVITSAERSDDPLASFLAAEHVPLMRGPLDDVFGRFLMAVEEFHLDWFFRISADSPLMRSDLMRLMLPYATEPADLVTNVMRRTFPRGNSLELIRSTAFRRIEANQLTAEEREHVTPYFYRNADRFHIVSIESVQPDDAQLAVDTIDDFRRIEAMVQAGMTPAPLRTETRILRSTVV